MLVSGLKHNPGIAVYWSAAEQTLLEELILKYASLSRSRVAWYAAIANHFEDKTVRDVVLRYRWMTIKENEKIRKDYSATNGACKTKNENSATNSISAAVSPNNEKCNSPPINFEIDDNGEISITDTEGEAGELLARNSQMLEKMSANLDNFLPEYNIYFLCQTRDNLLLLLNDSWDVPEKAKQVLPIPGIREELFDTILPLPSSLMDFSEQGF